MQTKTIQEYEFHLFLKAFQEAVLEGYTLDLETNENYPQKYGSHLYVNLVKAEEAVTGLPKSEPIVVTTLPFIPVTVPTEMQLFSDSETVVVASEQQASDLLTQDSPEQSSSNVESEELTAVAPEQVVAKVGRPKKV